MYDLRYYDLTVSRRKFLLQYLMIMLDYMIGLSNVRECLRSSDITRAKALEFTNRAIERNAEDTKIIDDLKKILEETKTFRLAHNQEFPENPINAKPVVKRDDINKLNTKTLAGIAAKYNAALKDAAK